MKKFLSSTLAAAVLAASAASAAENFGGLGISVWTGKGGVKVAGVLPNSPADNIGLQSGDIIISVNETDLSAIETGLQVSYLRGEPGSSISIVVERDGEKIALSTKRVGISVQDLDANDIAAWYGKSNGLTEEEISYLASQKSGEGYELLGVMQSGMPISKSAENLNADAMQHISVKKAEDSALPETRPIGDELLGNADIQNGKKELPLVNAKGVRVKKQGNVPLYKILR